MKERYIINRENRTEISLYYLTEFKSYTKSRQE